MNDRLRDVLEKQGYGLVGEHSAVKLCHWLRQKLLKGRSCYKEDFYGIECHRCLQMTTWLDCNQRCMFCWRYQGGDAEEIVPDDPEFILDGAVEAQARLVSGYRGIESVDEAMWKESREPNQVAISLAGEPTMYPHLGGFIGLARSRGMTTFLVTNGTRPDVLSTMDQLPSQLYVSVDAPNEEIYGNLCKPMEKGLWDRVVETLELFPSLDTRTVVRHTLVRDWNMNDVDGYAGLVSKAEPDFIEAKGYVFVGYSRLRMTIGNMPSHDEVRDFASGMEDATGYVIAGEKPASRVVVLTVDGKMPEPVRP